MTERPILFSAPMVRAILAGTKMQTRRVVKPQFSADAVPAEMPATDPIGGWVVGGHSGVWWCDAAANPDESKRCPYGQPGDRLWVREAFIGPYAYEVNEYPPRPTTSAIGAASEVIFLRIVALLRIATSMRPAVVMPPDSSVCN